MPVRTWWWTNGSPKHVEPLNEKIKTIQKNVCISLVYIQIASGYVTVQRDQSCNPALSYWKMSWKTGMTLLLLIDYVRIFLIGATASPPPPASRGFINDTRRSTVGRTSLDAWSAVLRTFVLVTFTCLFYARQNVKHFRCQIGEM